MPSSAPLLVQVLFHPESQVASDLALGLHRRLTGSAGSPGLRIPVSFSASPGGGLPPVAVDLEGASHTLVVALIDGRMAQRAREEDRRSADSWAQLLTRLTSALVKAGCPHGLLPVAVDAGAFGLTPELAQRSFVRLDRFAPGDGASQDELCFHVAAAALQLLRGKALPDEPAAKAPIQLFVSHAKADLPKAPSNPSEGPVLELLGHLAQGPVDGWYDAKSIPRGLRFDEAIEKGVIE